MEIDQILTKKLGGWVLITDKEWLALKPVARNEYLVNENVQFWSHGQQVNPARAAKQLDPSWSPIATGQIDEVLLSAVEIVPTRMLPALYQRVSVSNGYEVQRKLVDESPRALAEIRVRSADAYNLRNQLGLGALASDLICDAYGVADSSIISTELGVYLGNELSAQFFAGETWNLKAEVLRTFSEECPYINLA